MITLRPYQRRCLDAFYEYYEKNNGHSLIVVATAGGKGPILGGLVSEICQKWKDQRIIVLSHVRELIKQNHEKILLFWPNAPAGIYSASLGKRQGHHPIVVAAIQSVYKKANVLGHRDLCFIDEVHLCQPGNLGMYGQLIKDLLAINPAMKICGLTATDYRTDSGLLTEGEDALFDDVIIEIPIKYLLDEGYLTPPISKGMIVQANMEGVKITAGEYNIKAMAARFDQREFMNAALDSDMAFFEGRRSIALFCPTIENAQHVAEAMILRGVPCEAISGEMRVSERDDKLIRFRRGELRALASVGVITTGTDIPNMDCIVLLRATKSPGLYTQIIGRGFRVMYADGYDLDTKEGRLAAIKNGAKPNFIVLDHGNNIYEHGAITDVIKPQKKNKAERQRIPRSKIRICEICRSAWPLEITVCGTCNTELVSQRDVTANLEIEASNADIMGTPFSRGEMAQWFDIGDVGYSKHVKQGKEPTLKVTYYSGVMKFSEWKSMKYIMPWWKKRSDKPVPISVSDALKECETIRRPTRILVRKKEGLYEVLKYEF